MVTLATLYNDFKTLIKQNFYDKDETDDLLDEKQATLVSGTNIKTINNNSLLGSGNISISGSGIVDTSLDTSSTNPVQNQAIATEINSLNNSITNLTTTETITINPTNVSGATAMNFTLLGDKFVKLNWIDDKVTCSSSNIGTAILLGTLPQKYRPSTQQWFSQKYNLSTNSKGYQTSLRILINGQVSLLCWWTGSNQSVPCVFTDIYPLF